MLEKLATCAIVDDKKHGKKREETVNANKNTERSSCKGST